MSRVLFSVLLAAFLAPSALAQSIDDDPLMPDKEIYEQRATIEVEEEDETDRPPPGPDPGEPKLADRCYSHEVSVPPGDDLAKAYQAVEKQVEAWIATCVASRTPGKDGKPLHRERKLVRNNPSLKELVPLLEAGEKTTIEADYEFDGRRVVAIAFY